MSNHFVCTLTLDFHSFCQVTLCQRTAEVAILKRAIPWKIMDQFWSLSLPPESENGQRRNRNNMLKNCSGQSWNSIVKCENKQNFIHRIQMCDKTLMMSNIFFFGKHWLFQTRLCWFFCETTQNVHINVLCTWTIMNAVLS